MPIKRSIQKSDKSIPAKKSETLKKSKSNTKVILKKSDKSQTKVNNAKVVTDMEVYKSNTLVIQQLEDFSAKIPEIDKMLNWFKDNIDKPVEAVENKFEIDTKNCKGEIKSFTFKIYEGVAKKLDKFIEKQSNFKKQDIISTMIIEFIDKYSK
jgi:hypothetical protein